MADLFIGVDPGTTGAVAVLRPLDNYLDVWDMPTYLNRSKRVRVSPGELGRLLGWVLQLGTPHAWIEEVTAMPKQGVSSTFAFGQAFGIAQGVVAGLQIPMVMVRPREWQKEINLSVRRSKDEHRLRAQQEWPSYAHHFARVKDHNRADAALIALAHATRWGALS